MARVADNKTQVQATGKVDCELDLGYVGDVEGILREASQGAGLAQSSVLRLTCSTLEERGHD